VKGKGEKDTLLNHMGNEVINLMWCPKKEILEIIRRSNKQITEWGAKSHWSLGGRRARGRRARLKELWVEAGGSGRDEEKHKKKSEDKWMLIRIKSTAVAAAICAQNSGGKKGPGDKRFV